MILSLVLDPLKFYGMVFHESPVLIYINSFVYLTRLGIVLNPVWEVLDVAWFSLGILSGIFVVTVWIFILIYEILCNYNQIQD